MTSEDMTPALQQEADTVDKATQVLTVLFGEARRPPFTFLEVSVPTRTA